MAEVRWIKLNVGMFDGNSFKKIKKAKIGGESFRDKLTAVWFELMDFAGKCNAGGQLIENPEIPFSSLEDIAILIDREPEELNLCMQYYINNRMITVIDDVLMLTNWAKYQNTDGLDKIREQTRIRVARHRENQKALLGNKVCQYCGGIATGEDHIVARARGGSDDESNKVPCCIDCNRIKNDKPLVDFLNSNRDRIRDDLILKNVKLQKHVTLCNVTNCYTVTLPNATEIDIEQDVEEDIETISASGNAPKVSKEDIEKFFETIWKLYPNKKGKGQISDAKKKALYNIGIEEMTRAIERYKTDLAKEDWRKSQNGSTFFNSGYVDYLDANYEPLKVQPQKSTNKFNNFQQRQYTAEQMAEMERMMLGM